MRISVVIPAFNAEATIAEAVRAALVAAEGASVEPEVVVVNDGSTDNTASTLASLAADHACVHVVSQPNAGVSAARNAGLARATGDVVIFADADDMLLPNSLAHVASLFELHSPDCVICGMRIEPPELAPATLAERTTPRNAVYEGFSPRLIFGEATHPYAWRVAFSRTFLRDNMLEFDTTLTLGEDEAFLFSAYRLARRSVLSSERIYLYRMDTASVSHRDNRSLAELPHKLDKHLDMIASITNDWMQRGLDRSCDDELLTWCLDLFVLDISRLAPPEQRDCYARLWRILGSYFGTSSLGTHAHAHRATQSVCRAVERALGSDSIPVRPVVGRATIVRLYVSTRGLGAVVRRFVRVLGGRGAY